MHASMQNILLNNLNLISHKVPVLLESLHEFCSFDCFSFSARSNAFSIKIVKFFIISSSDISFFYNKSTYFMFNILFEIRYK